MVIAWAPKATVPLEAERFCCVRFDSILFHSIRSKMLVKSAMEPEKKLSVRFSWLLFPPPSGHFTDSHRM